MESYYNVFAPCVRSCCDPLDIVAVPFPFADRPAVKRRPAGGFRRPSRNRGRHRTMAPSHSSWRNRCTGTISTPWSSRRRRGSWQTTSFRGSGISSARASKPLTVADRNARLGLDLDGDGVADDEVHLELRLAAPVGQGVVAAPVVEPASHLQEHQVLQRAAVGVRSRFDDAGAAQGVGDADVEEVELGGRHRLPGAGAAERRKLIADEGVLENPVVLAHGARGQSGVRGDLREVDLLAVGQARHVEKAAEVADRAGQPFGLHLLLQVRPDVRPEVVPPRRRVEERRQAAAVRAIQKPVVPDFRRHQRVQPRHARAAGEQVGAAPLELARAAAGQHEPERPVAFDQQVNLVQQRRALLDLVDDHDLAARVQGLPQVLGMEAQLPERVGFEEVVDGRVGNVLADERALAGLAGAEQEDGTVSDESPQIEGATVHISDTIADLHENQQL